jgi:hypothetical protein
VVAVNALALSVRDGSPSVDVPAPYVLTERSADLFVVDTTDVVELRRRCPELFAPRPDDAA